MNQAIFAQAIREFFRPKRILWWVLFGVLCGLLAKAWPQFQPDVSKEGQYTSVVSIFLFRMVALASAIMTAAIVSQEVEQRTIVYMLTRPIKRSAFILFRYLASVIVMVAISTFGLICISFGCGLGLGNSQLPRDILAITFGAAGYGALFLFISLLLNRSMLVCLLYAFAWETAIPNLPGDLFYLSINTYIQGIAQHASTDANRTVTLAGGMKSMSTLPTTTSMIVLGIVAASLVAISMVWFTKFEFVPREDAE